MFDFFRFERCVVVSSLSQIQASTTQTRRAAVILNSIRGKATPAQLGPDQMLQHVTVVVKSLRHLPQQFFSEEKERELALSRHWQQQGHHQQQGRGAVDYRRCLRAQASIVSETRETGNSVWGRGVRSRQATWLRGSDKLSWSLTEQQFKQIKAYTPVCKVRWKGR